MVCAPERNTFFEKEVSDVHNFHTPGGSYTTRES